MSPDAASLGVPTAGAVPRDAMTPVVTLSPSELTCSPGAALSAQNR